MAQVRRIPAYVITDGKVRTGLIDRLTWAVFDPKQGGFAFPACFMVSRTNALFHPLTGNLFERGMWNMTVFIQYLVNGLSMGSVYAIIALGYTMVYGIAKMLNFARRRVIMVGAYVSFCATSDLRPPGWASVILVWSCTRSRCSHRGSGIEAAASGGPAGRSDHGHRRILLPAERRQLLGRHAQELHFARHLPVPEFLASSNVRCRRRHHRRLPGYHGRSDVAEGKTKMGKAMRAVSEDKAAAQLYGHQRQPHHLDDVRHRLRPLPPSPVCSCVLLAGPAAHHGRHAWHQGLRRRRFGGIGFIPGAFVGGILIGIIEAMAQAYISTSLANSIVFGVLDRRPARQACRPLGQVRPREGEVTI